MTRVGGGEGHLHHMVVERRHPISISSTRGTKGLMCEFFSCPKSRDLWQSCAWPLESARPRNFQRFQSLPFGNKYVQSFLGNTLHGSHNLQIQKFSDSATHHLPGSRRFNRHSWVFKVFFFFLKQKLKFFLLENEFLEFCPYSLIHLLMHHRLWDTNHDWKMLCQVRWWWRQQWLYLVVA